VDDHAGLAEVGTTLRQRMQLRQWLETNHASLFADPLAMGKDYVLVTSRQSTQYFDTKDQLTRHMRGLPTHLRDLAVYKYRRASEMIYML